MKSYSLATFLIIICCAVFCLCSCGKRQQNKRLIDQEILLLMQKTQAELTTCVERCRLAAKESPDRDVLLALANSQQVLVDRHETIIRILLKQYKLERISTASYSIEMDPRTLVHAPLDEYREFLAKANPQNVLPEVLITLEITNKVLAADQIIEQMIDPDAEEKPAFDFYLCPVCGHLSLEEPSKNCLVCHSNWDRQIKLKNGEIPPPEQGTFVVDYDSSTTSGGVGGAGGIQIRRNYGGSSFIGDNLVVPPKHYAVVGRETNIYYDNLYKCSSKLFETEINATAGKAQNERFTYTPADTGDVTVQVCARDLYDYTMLAKSSTVLCVASTSAGAWKNIKCSFIGDSIMQSGWITGELLNIAKDDDMDITLIGLRGIGDNRHEGRGGYSIKMYTSGTETFYRFTVSGIRIAPRINGSIYTLGDSEFKVQETELSNGFGSITCQLLSGPEPNGSGTLTKTNQFEGDARIAFSAVEKVPANPFWFNGKVNYKEYLSSHSFATPDFVFIQLGTNDVFRQTTDDGVRIFCKTAFAQYDMLIASIQEAGVKYVGLMLCPPPAATQDAFGAAYGAIADHQRVKRNYVVWNEEMMKKYGNSEDNGVFIIPSNTGLDTYHNFPIVEGETANSRTSVTVFRQDNAVHPTKAGANQIADAVWAFLKNKAHLVGTSYTVNAPGTNSGT